MLRGIAAISIMFAHYVIYGMRETDSFSGPIIIMQWAGGLGVGLFFFCSGYGLMSTTINHKIDFGWLKHRFINVLPTYWTLNVFLLLLRKNECENIILSILGIENPAWFIVEIMIIYMLFYIAFHVGTKYRILNMAVLLFIMSVIFLVLNFEARWYNTNFIFIIGMLCSKYKEKIILYLYHNFYLKLLGSLFLFGIFALAFIATRGTMVGNLMKIISDGLLNVVFIQIIMKIKLNSPLIIYMGKNSLQLYVIHTHIWYFFSSYMSKLNIQLKFIICVCVSVLCMTIYNYFKYIFKISYRKYKKIINQ